MFRLALSLILLATLVSACGKEGEDPPFAVCSMGEERLEHDFGDGEIKAERFDCVQSSGGACSLFRELPVPDAPAREETSCAGSISFDREY